MFKRLGSNLFRGFSQNRIYGWGYVAQRGSCPKEILTIVPQVERYISDFDIKENLKVNTLDIEVALHDIVEINSCILYPSNPYAIKQTKIRDNPDVLWIEELNLKKAQRAFKSHGVDRELLLITIESDSFE